MWWQFWTCSQLCFTYRLCYLLLNYFHMSNFCAARMKSGTVANILCHLLSFWEYYDQPTFVFNIFTFKRVLYSNFFTVFTGELLCMFFNCPPFFVREISTSCFSCQTLTFQDLHMSRFELDILSIIKQLQVVRYVCGIVHFCWSTE